VEIEGSKLAVRWADGLRSRYAAIWLRDNCPCSQCCHPSGQRLLDTITIPDDVAPVSALLSNDGLALEWNDGHQSALSPAWLRAHSPSLSTDRRSKGETLWDARIRERLPEGRFAEVSSSEARLRDWLVAVDRFGFALLHGVPSEPGAIFRVVDLFGYVRETNYGRLFDVKSVVNPNNLAYTGLTLGAHTDNPYRDPTPTLQLLHCLSSSASGGESTLVDGFRVAETLRSSAPEQVELLARYPILFRFQDETTDLAAEVPVITTNQQGQVTAIHFNNRSKMPFVMDEDVVEPYYAAYRAFGRLLGSPEFQIALTLGPGDLVIMDNTRVLHGRTGFSAAGQRHLQGCYADRDGLRSRLAVLNRTLSARRAIVDEIFARFRERGDGAYLGEPVSMTEHMLQAAHAAERDGASPTLIAAALLHDYGHLIHDLREDCAEQGIDSRHEDLGHEFLSKHFAEAVAEPVRLHVAAKRYLCAVDPSYFEALSPASILSLELQGGPFSPAEVEEFERSPYAQDAVRLRRYDDAGKEAGASTPDLEHYRLILESALK
jgi:gamma-butyrobetaine dioxygenase